MFLTWHITYFYRILLKKAKQAIGWQIIRISISPIVKARDQYLESTLSKLSA